MSEMRKRGPNTRPSTASDTLKRTLRPMRIFPLRGLDLHLARVDQLLATLIPPKERPREVYNGSATRGIRLALHESVRLRTHGQIDRADGTYMAAADLEQILKAQQAKPQGHDRTLRSRVRRLALYQFSVAHDRPVTLEVPSSGTDARCLVPIHATLREDPSAAVAELDKIRGSGERAGLSPAPPTRPRSCPGCACCRDSNTVTSSRDCVQHLSR